MAVGSTSLSTNVEFLNDVNAFTRNFGIEYFKVITDVAAVVIPVVLTYSVIDLYVTQCEKSSNGLRNLAPELCIGN